MTKGRKATTRAIDLAGTIIQLNCLFYRGIQPLTCIGVDNALVGLVDRSVHRRTNIPVYSTACQPQHLFRFRMSHAYITNSATYTYKAAPDLTDPSIHSTTHKHIPPYR
jgi:hypothetical protein